MKKWILLLTLCISLLLSGCQKTPEAQPGTQPAEAPWADEQADAPLSYEDYFAELRPYDPAENDVPDWMKDGNYEILSEDGVLSLYQAEDGTLTRLFAYPVEAPLGWSAGQACLYAFDEQTIYRLDYGGEAAEPIYRATDGAILQMAAAGDALFFAEQGELSIRLCRLYAPEGKLDVFYDEVRPDAEDLLLFPVSNHELYHGRSGLSGACGRAGADLHRDAEHRSCGQEHLLGHAGAGFWRRLRHPVLL